jgi:MinD superfamily P-loop ATPase
VRELTVISGKGGTGKTTIVAAFASLADAALVVDCDVETPDLHLLLDPTVQQRSEFVGGKTAFLRWDLCTACGRCAELCRFGAIVNYGPPNRFADRTYVVDGRACEGCALCAAICPARAITMGPSVDGEWYVSDTRSGPLVHARLQPARGNSGKLVSLLRQESRTIAAQRERPLVLCDGVPGIGCPTIASIAGADLALVVVEPSVSGLHDFERVAELCRHFSVPVSVCVNRFDINAAVTQEIERRAAELDATMVGRIPDDPAVVQSQLQSVSIVEHGGGPAADATRNVWQRVHARLMEVSMQARSDVPGETPLQQERRQ